MICKKIITLFCFIASMQSDFAQTNSVDIKLQTILTEKNDDIRIENIYDYFLSIQELDVELNLKAASTLLNLAQKRNDNIAEVLAISQISYQSYTTGNTKKSLEYSLKALKMAEQIGNPGLLAIVSNRLAHNYAIDLVKKKEIYSTAFNNAIKTSNFNIQFVTAANVGNTYLQMDNLDSALFYLQKAEQLSEKATQKGFKSTNFIAMGNTYAAMKNTTLAVAYYNLALQQSIKSKSPRWLSDTYATLAKFYNDNSQTDSSIFYAKKSIATVENTGFSNNVIGSAKLLTDIYRNKNNDSAMKYADLYRIVNDSINNLKSIRQNQLLTFEEDLRQQEVASEKIKEEQQRKQNIQYALIALGIIILLTLYLLLSRSFITNTKLIEFFGVVALLIVFEFLNLLLHPFLERVTNHSPILMLLALVCIAALLVPLHHKVEKWATAKLVEKNKKIRLAAAKKTIEQLEKEI